MSFLLFLFRKMEQKDPQDGNIWAAVVGIIVLMFASAVFIFIAMKVNGVWPW